MPGRNIPHSDGRKDERKRHKVAQGSRLALPKTKKGKKKGGEDKNLKRGGTGKKKRGCELERVIKPAARDLQKTCDNFVKEEGRG